MLLRDTYLRKGQALSDSGTYIIDLNLTEPISMLELLISATNGATSNQGVRVHDDVDKIELVDGSDVIYSGSGILTRALNYFETGHEPYGLFTEAAAGVQTESFLLNFGRYPGDEEYYLDPKKYRNLQLKITTSLTISATAGFATGTGSLDVIAKVFSENPPAEKGCMMSKDLYDFTSVASGDELITLPTDYDYRMLMVRAFESGTAINTDINNLKLSCNSDAFIPFDLQLIDLLAKNVNWRGNVVQALDLLRTDGDTIATWYPVIKQAAANAFNDFDLASFDVVGVNVLTLQLLTLTATPTIAKSTSDTKVLANIVGQAPYFSVAYPFGDLINPDDFFPAKTFKSMELKLTQGGAGAAVSVMAQQIRS